MVVVAFVRAIRGQLREHIDLIPLMGCYIGAATLSSSIMLYTSLRKEDVSWNRWWNPVPSMHINPEKHQQRLIVPSAENKLLYKHDYPVENLRKEIYDHHDWIHRSSGH